jgi:hypothetical protein
MTDPERLANQLEHEARKAFQAWLDAALAPGWPASAEQTRAKWEPIRQFQKEGPDVGYREEPKSKDCRIN